MKKVISKLISIYFIFILFYGIVIKCTYKNSFLFSIKTIFPELILVIISFCCLMIILFYKKIKINLYCDFLFFYINFIIILNILNEPQIWEIMYTVRDLYIPILAMFMLQKIDFNYNEKDKLIDNILKILIVFVILGSILAVIQHILNWKWTSNFYVGREFYGTDPITKIKITQSNGVLRVPSVSGNCVSFAFYNLIALIFIVNSKLKKSKKYILIFLSGINIYLSTNKTCLLIFMLILFYINVKDLSNNMKIIMYNIFAFIILLIFLYVFTFKISILKSMFERIIFWKELAMNNGILDIVFPRNIFNLTSAATGIYSFMDNSYLYFLLSIGILGILVLLKIVKNSIKTRYRCFNTCFIITFLFGSLTTNLTQGRVFFNVFVIMLAIFGMNYKGGNECLKLDL